MHLFLTGPKHVGKSTLLKTILRDIPGKLGGFYTLRLNTWLPGQNSVHLFRPWESQLPTEENLLFVCSRHDADTVCRFERLGCQALEESGDADLLVMDELGPHEAEAEAFQRAVWSAVEGDIPILGILQQADSLFLERIAQHPKVYVLQVTKENRDDLAKRIPELIHILMMR